MRKFQGRVGFRYILVHEYQKIDMNFVVQVIEHHSRDLLAFANKVLGLTD